MAKAIKKEEVKKELEVVPTIEYTGSNTAQAATIFKGEDQSTLPIIKSIGVRQIPGSRYFVSYTLYTQGDQVVKVEVDEPNMRAIAEDSAKSNFVQLFMSQEIEE